MTMNCLKKNPFNTNPMEFTYRLEFNEEQQAFHVNTGEDEPHDNGWFTIYERCTEFKWDVYEAFVYRVLQEKLTKEYLLECAVQVDAFINNLSERSITISQYGKILPNTTELYEYDDDEDVYEPDGHSPYRWSRCLDVRRGGIRTVED